MSDAVADSAAPRPAAVSIHNAHKWYGTHEVLSGVDLTVQPGQVTVILFDEPTSALDPELVREVLDVIKDLATSGTTLIIVTHEIGFAREVADTVVFLDGGRIVEQGPPAQVLDHPEHPRTREFLSRVL